MGLVVECCCCIVVASWLAWISLSGIHKVFYSLFCVVAFVGLSGICACFGINVDSWSQLNEDPVQMGTNPALDRGTAFRVWSWCLIEVANTTHIS